MRSDLTATIDLDRLAHNVALLRGCCQRGVEMCIAVKANGYGHGAAIIVPELARLGVERVAVATLAEAVEVRGLGWSRPILIFGNVLTIDDAVELRDRIMAIIEHDLRPTITDAGALTALSQAAQEQKRILGVEIAVDTGLGREGVMPEQVAVLLTVIQKTPGLCIVGIYSHFAAADLSLPDLADQQLATFRTLTSRLASELPTGTTRHLANSAATLVMPDAHFDMVRPGIAVYGYAPSDTLLNRFDLKPILRLTSHVTVAKDLPSGHCVGYGKTFTTSRPTRLGIVPIGFTDGFLRGLSNRAVVGTTGGDAPIIGRISMDQMAIDLTDCPGVGAGSPVVLIDDDPGRPNSIASLARLLGTIPYEVTCLLGDRIDRIAVRSSPPDVAGGTGTKSSRYTAPVG